MSQVPNWFERKFEFTFPLELYPGLLMRLRGTPVRLEELVRDCSPQALARKAGEKWSAQEHVGHLLDLESLWIARVQDFAGSGTELTKADLSNRKTHEANHNARPITELLAEFRQARKGLLQTVEEKIPGVFARTLLHPRLQQPMRLIDHLYFAAEHDDHHLAWIWALLHEAPSERP